MNTFKKPLITKSIITKNTLIDHKRKSQVTKLKVIKNIQHFILCISLDYDDADLKKTLLNRHFYSFHLLKSVRYLCRVHIYVYSFKVKR